MLSCWYKSFVKIRGEWGCLLQMVQVENFTDLVDNTENMIVKKAMPSMFVFIRLLKLVHHRPSIRSFQIAFFSVFITRYYQIIKFYLTSFALAGVENVILHKRITTFFMFLFKYYNHFFNLVKHSKYSIQKTQFGLRLNVPFPNTVNSVFG